MYRNAIDEVRMLDLTYQSNSNEYSRAESELLSCRYTSWYFNII